MLFYVGDRRDKSGGCLFFRKEKLVKALLQCQEFLSVTQGESGDEEKLSEELAAFTAAKDFPERAKCATLAWDEMLEFLAKKNKK